MHETFSAEVSPDEAGNHQVEPEYVETYEPRHKRVKHVQSAILHVLARLIVALLMQAVYDVHREVPQSKVDPGHDHADVEEHLHEVRGYVDGDLEHSHCEVGEVMQDHYCGANREHIQ